MRYTVTVSRVVKVRIANIDAESQTEAVEVAEESPFHILFPTTDRTNLILNTQHNPDGTLPTILWTEDGDETLEYLVDEEGDPENERSRWYASDGVSTPDWVKEQAEKIAATSSQV